MRAVIQFKRCPRCTGLIPNNQQPGEYAGATSRVDNETEICSPCGSDEAERIAKANEMVPMHDWPVSNPHEYRSVVAS